MGKVILGTMMSLDGFISDRTGSLAALYPDMTVLHATESLKESIARTGAVVMGRHAADMANGDWTGYEYQVPLYVLTHHPPAEPPRGQNANLRVLFVTDGIASAIRQARAAAGDKDVTIVGGAQTAQQALREGLADELHIGIAPALLGQGLRFFENLEDVSVRLKEIQVIHEPGITEIRYRVIPPR